MSPSKFRAQQKHQQKRQTAFKATHGKTWAEMTDEERTRVRRKFSVVGKEA